MVKLLRFLLCCCILLSTLNMFSSNFFTENSLKEENNFIDKDTLTTSGFNFLEARKFRKFKSLEKFDRLPNKSIKKESVKVISKVNSKSVLNPKTEKLLAQASKAFQQIDESGNYIDQLEAGAFSQLPVAIAPKKIGNVTYTVGISKAALTPTTTNLTAFLKIVSAQGTLILGAENIKLSHDGGILGDAKLSLLSNVALNFNSGQAKIILNRGSNGLGTYASIDCDGFKDLTLDADLQFLDTEFIFPVNKEGEKIENNYLKGNFKAKQVSSWNDIIAELSLPDFGIKGLKGFGFNVNEAHIDFSDLRNAEGIPGAYLSKHFKGENQSLWQGVRIGSLDLMLPKAFKKNNANKRVAIKGQQLLIDGKGVSGKFSAENLLSITEGAASKWQFSVTKFLVELEANSLLAGAFEGGLIVPVSKKTEIAYKAIIQPDEYTLRVSNATKDLDFDIWNAGQVVLTSDSFVEMKVKEDQFLPKANFSGQFNISSKLKKSAADKDDDKKDTSKKSINFKGITFQNLVLQTESPKLAVEAFGYNGKSSLSNFPVSINEFEITTPSDNRADLGFRLNVNLTSENDGANGGSAKLKIKGKLEENKGWEKWKFKGVELEQLQLQMAVAGLELRGSIDLFEDDETYGEGFAGAVEAKFNTGLSLEVQSKVLFGRTETFRYWFADLQGKFTPAIPVFTGFAMNAIGGGFYNRMKMEGVSNTPNAAFDHIGGSSSGVIYAPYEDNGFGMKASVGLITQNSEDLFHATLEFGMAFKRSGGLQDIYFKGHGELLTSLPGDFYEQVDSQLNEVISDSGVSLDKDKLVSRAQETQGMSADVFIGYDFVNDILHANSELYINYGIIKGVGANNKAGWMDFYVSPDEWHILIGTPNDPVGTKLDIGILQLKTRTYFMMGDDLPGSPAPPSEVMNNLKEDPSELDDRDLNLLTSGKGLAFGTRFDASTGDLRFLIFYARFDAGVGFDVMLKDYGDAHCKGSSEQIGLNGWYANGQAYAYLQGSVGLKIRVFGIKKKVNVFSGEGALLLKARLPNPSWFRGYLAGSYDVLGGLVKGRFRFKIEIGDKCEVVGDVLDGIVVIGDMTPKDGGKEIDVFAAPQVLFNLPINKIFEIPEDSGDQKYRILMDKFEVIDASGKAIVGKLEWNSSNDAVVFYSHEILPPKAKLKAFVQLHFEKQNGGNWEKIKEDGEIATETKEVNFTTRVAPKTIPLSNIAYMYPVLGQKNFFIKEYNKGYINLKRGQSYLFEGLVGWKKNIRMTAETGTKINANFGYNSGQKQVTYAIPKDLNLKTDYKANFSLIPPAQNTGANIEETYNTKNLETDVEDGSTVVVRSRKAKKQIIKGEERKLLEYGYRTSEYATFKQKMDAVKEGNDYLTQYVPYPFGLTLSITTNRIEPFEKLELVGNKYTENKPLVIAKATTDNAYYTKDIYPLLYEKYPLYGDIRVKRETDKIGVPPVEGVEPFSWYLSYLEEGNLAEVLGYNPYRYNLTHYYYKDYKDLRSQFVNTFPNWEELSKHKALVAESFPVMKNGKYKTSFKYVLPGQIKIGKENTVKYVNPLYEQ